MASTFGCPHCGKSNPLHATFCGSCGVYLQGIDASAFGRQDDTEQAESPPPAQPPPPSGDPTQSQPWLRPDFDPPDPPPATSVSTADQPWLQPEETSEAEETPPVLRPQRLIGGLQGLIEPLSIPAGEPPPAPAGALPTALPDEMQRLLRAGFAGDVPMHDEFAQASAPPDKLPARDRGLERHSWIYVLLLAGLLFGLWADNAPADSSAHAWPGVDAAFTAIESLPPASVVLINWAYDPAFAGEMDQTSLPVLEHLLRRELRLVVVSQLPGGPATARRMLTAADTGAPVTRQLDAAPVEAGYLPGGISALPLLGEAPARTLPTDIQGRAVGNRQAISALRTDSPALLLIVAGQAEDVQRWLEQVQPLTDAPLVAVTAAGADPPLRPYVDSGQITGIVSGYAGGIAYQQRMGDVITSARQETRRRQMSGQNWAMIVLVLVVVAGNLTALFEGRES